MGIQLNKIFIENFKSFSNLTEIPVSDLSVFLGANSSGKSTALQVLLALKQTIECNSPDIELLLSGNYVTLGEYKDVVNNKNKRIFKIGVNIERKGDIEEYEDERQFCFFWEFSKSNDFGIYLKQIKYNLGDKKIRFVRTENNVFDIIIGNKPTIFSIQINNLNFSKLFVNYNEEFNNHFYGLLKDLERCLLPTKTTRSLKNEGMIAFDQVDHFYFDLITQGFLSTDSVRASLSNDAKHLAEDIRKIIDKYIYFQGGKLSHYYAFTDKKQEQILQSQMIKFKDIKELNKIITKYEKIYNEFDKIGQKNIKLDTKKEQSLDVLFRIKDDNRKDNQRYNLIHKAYFDYCEILKEVFDQIFYLGPIREEPQGLYNFGFDTVPKYVGSTGSFFASVLLGEKNKKKEYILPANEKYEISLSEALDEWMSHLDVASSIKVNHDNSFGFSVSICNKQQVQSDIMNVGIGTSQILPVLIMGLLSEEGEYLIYEQPELHLHPYSQSRLADFFVALAKHGRRIIVETHSEYLLLRLRYQVLINNINQSDITVNFFQNKNGTKISQGVLSDYGNLQYPEDFKDETQQLLEDLMHAALAKKDK